MAWPRGVPRKQKAEEVVAGEGETAAPAAVVQKTSAAPRKKSWTMKAGNNWDNADPTDDNPDRLHIPKHMFPKDPDMDLQWCTESVYGKEFPQRMSQFYRKGWTVVHPSDFGGRFDGMFTPKGSDDAIKVDGLVLCARPLEISLKAKKKDIKEARERIAIKEAALTGGQMDGVTGASHPSARGFNHIRKSIEQVEIPQE